MNERERLRRRLGADVKVGLARVWARARQIVTTDPTESDDDDRVVEVLELAKNRYWLTKVSSAIYQHWHRQNARKKEREGMVNVAATDSPVAAAA